MKKINIFELSGSILLNDQGVSDKIKNHDSAASKLGKTFGGLGKVALIAGGAIAAGFGAALVMGMKGVSEGEDAIAQLDAVLKSTGGSAGVIRKDLLDMADQMQKTTKFTQEETLAAESLLLTFTNIGSKTFPRATQAAADMATALGTDMAGQSIALGKALNNPTKGITALTRVGVTFTDEQKKSIKAMQESGDMAGAQTVILKELEKEFGGSAKAAGQTFSGQLIILKNAFGEVTEALALQFMPYLQKFLDFVIGNMPKIEKFFTVAFDVIGKVLTTVWGIIQNNLIPAFQSLRSWLATNMPLSKNDVNNAFISIQKMFKTVSDFVTTHLVPIFNNMKDMFSKNFPAIKAAVQKAYDYIKPSFDRLVQTIKESVMPILMGLWDTVKKAIPGVKAIFQIAMPLIVFAVKLAINVINLIIKIVTGMYIILKPGLDKVATLFSTIFGGIKKVIDGVQWVLDKFNLTKLKDKSATVTTRQVTERSNSRGSNLGYASGTDYATPGEHWVGEEGPEIVNFSGGETVTNAKDSAKIASRGLTLNIENFINNRKEDIEELAEELAFFMDRKKLGGSR